MSRSILDQAKLYMRKRRFSQAIEILMSQPELYQGDFDYYLTCGICCLYLGDNGSAYGYFERARQIKLNNTSLLLGQAAIFLRRGETNRAIQYYLDVLSLEPGNRTAAKAMEFIRRNGDNYTEICRMSDSGKIQQFYPPVGFNPNIITRSVALAVICCAAGFGIYSVIPKPSTSWIGPRANLESMKLSSVEKDDPLLKDLSGALPRYMLTKNQITQSYENAFQYFQDHRDNMSQVEVNRLLSSNATITIKQKVGKLMTYYQSPTFDTLKDNFSYKTVMEDPHLYQDTYVIWDGRTVQHIQYENGALDCGLFVGYQDFRSYEGLVQLHFDSRIITTPLDPEKPIRILGKVSFRTESGRDEIILDVLSYHQPLKGNKLN